MFYKVEYQKRAHQEVEKIFRVLLPEQGLAVREEQIRLCHEMLDTLLGERITLCDAGVGIGKTYAYLVACVLMRKYSILMERNSLPKQHPVVVSTSSIALQKAILSEYVPFLSRVLVEQGIIQTPLRAVVRKGKEHFVCDNRLEQRIEAIRHKQKNAVQKEALLSLRKHYDMDTVKDLRRPSLTRMSSAPMRRSSKLAVDSHPKKQGAMSSNFAGILVSFPVGCGVPHQKTGPPRWGQAQSFFVLCGRLSGCRGVPGVRSRRPGGCWSRGRGRPSSLRSGS